MNPQSPRLLEANLAAMRDKNPALAAKLAALTGPAEGVIAGRARDGSPMLGVRRTDGPAVPLGDPNGPAAEAARWAASLGADCLRCSNLIVAGFASGQYAERLLEACDEESLIWIWEPGLPLLRAAFHLRDFGPLIRSPRVRFLCGLTPRETAEALFTGTEANRTRAQGVRLAVPPVFRALYADAVARLSEEIRQAIEFDKLKFHTEEIQGRIILNNVAQNLPLVAEGASVLDLMHRAAGLPAWIVAPGPSLEDAIEPIRRHSANAVVIAADTANRILRQRGLSADIVVGVDFTELNARHFDAADGDPARLAAFAGVDPSIPRKYPGNTFFFAHGCNRLVQSLETGAPLGELESPGSTAHAAYSLARLMGCSPIILIGNDLSFPGRRWYAEGAMQYELDNADRESEPLFEVPANNGPGVQTNALYKIYLESFTQLIRESGGRAFNASAIGAKIEGAPYAGLEELIGRYCPAPIGKGFIDDALRSRGRVPASRWRGACAQAAGRCRRAGERLETLRGEAARLSAIPRKFRPGMADVMKRFAAMVEEEGWFFHLAIPLCARSTTALFGRLGNVGLFGGDTDEANRLARSKFAAFLDDFIQAAADTEDALESVPWEG